MTSLEKLVRPLGASGIVVSPIGLGVMQFAGGEGIFKFAFPALTDEEKTEIIKVSLEGGINWFDTAELYGFGKSEQGLSKALHTLGIPDSDVVIGTKWLPLLRTARNIPRSVEKRIQHLDGYTIDLYMVHQPIGFSSPETEMDAMADLVKAGKIRSVGVSNFSAERMTRAYDALEKRGIPLAVNQVHYSLLHRNIETDGILETAKELGVTIVAYTPLGYGMLTGKYHQDPSLLQNQASYRRRRLERQIESSRPLVEAILEIASAMEATPAQIALNWLVNFHGEIVVAIPGATKVSQAAQNAGAMHITLSPQDMQRLDTLSRPFRET